MARKRSEVNTIRGKRLGELLSWHDIDQKDFAEKIGYTKEHISYVINGHRNLTLDAAEKIVKMFPEIRIEWLMGYDDYPTRLDADAAPLIHEIDARKGSRGAMLMLARLAGYEITAAAEDGAKCYRVAISSAGYSKEQINLVYVISKGGKEIGRCDDSKYHALAKEVAEFAEFKLQKLCNELGGEHNG